MNQKILLILGVAMLVGCTSSAVRMHEAAFDGNVSRVQRFLDRGVSANAIKLRFSARAAKVYSFVLEK